MRFSVLSSANLTFNFQAVWVLNSAHLHVIQVYFHLIACVSVDAFILTVITFIRFCHMQLKLNRLFCVTSESFNNKFKYFRNKCHDAEIGRIDWYLLPDNI